MRSEALAPVGARVTLGWTSTDVRQHHAREQAVAQRFGRIDVLVNNAAVLLSEDEDVLAIPADAYQRTFETNVLGAIESAAPSHPRWPAQAVRVSSTCPPGRAARDDVHLRAGILNLESRPQSLDATSWRRPSRQRRAWSMPSIRDGPDGHGGASAPRSPKEGADTLVWLATLPDDGRWWVFRDRRGSSVAARGMTIYPIQSTAAAPMPTSVAMLFVTRRRRHPCAESAWHG